MSARGCVGDGKWQVIEWDWSHDPTLAWLHGLGLDITHYTSKQALLVQQQDVLSAASRLTDVGGWDLGLSHYAYDLVRVIARGLPRRSGLPPQPRPNPGTHQQWRGAQQHARSLRTSANHGTGWSMEIPALTCDGRQIWIHTHGEVHRRHGVAIRLVGAIQDITRNKIP